MTVAEEEEEEEAKNGRGEGTTKSRRRNDVNFIRTEGRTHFVYFQVVLKQLVILHVVLATGHLGGIDEHGPVILKILAKHVQELVAPAVRRDLVNQGLRHRSSRSVLLRCRVACCPFEQMAVDRRRK
jgi:hypothetical protein